MSRDDTKLAYYSGWDIDQLVNNPNPIIAVGSGDTAIYTIPTTSVPIPDFHVQFKPGSSTFWYEPGTSSTDGTTANEFTFSSYISGNQIFISTTTSGIARYFIWTDKINY